MITFGPLEREAATTCETAAQALALVLKLRADQTPHITVTHIENDDAAIEMLRVLAIHEAST